MGSRRASRPDHNPWTYNTSTPVTISPFALMA